MSTPVPVEYKVIDVVCQLLKSQLDLTDEQVWIYNQKRDIPRGSGLYIEVEFLSSKPFGVRTHCDNDEYGNFTEYQSSAVQETYAIRLFSRDESALSRAWEAHLALTGVASQQLQEQYCFKLADLPMSFSDESFLEASARLFRQGITFNALRAYHKQRIISYYDRFQIPPTIHVNQ